MLNNLPPNKMVITFTIYRKLLTNIPHNNILADFSNPLVWLEKLSLELKFFNIIKNFTSTSEAFTPDFCWINSGDYEATSI